MSSQDLNQPGWASHLVRTVQPAYPPSVTISTHHAALDLVEGRARALKTELTSLGDRFDQAEESRLARAIAESNRQERPVLGLLLAEKVLRRAQASGSTSAMQDFVFRFAAHLKASVGLRSLENEERVVLAMAALRLFRTGPRMARHADETDVILERLPAVQTSDRTWRKQLGLSADDFAHRVDVLTSSLTRAGRSRHDPSSPVLRPPKIVRDLTSHKGMPEWLFLGSLDPASPVSSSRNWPTLEASTGDMSLEKGWHLFQDGDYRSARAALWSVYAGCDTHWSPNRTVEGSRTWNWLRLTWLLGVEAEGQLTDRRRGLISALDAARRSVPENDSLILWLTEETLRDYIAVDPEMQDSWAIHASRVVFATGQECLDVYSAEEKAELRSAWHRRYGSIVSGLKQTHQMVESLTSEFKYRVQELLRASEADSSVQRRLNAPLRRMEVFLDRHEREVAEEVRAVAGLTATTLAREHLLVSDSDDLLEGIALAREHLATSESLLLQDCLGPALVAMANTCTARRQEIGSGSKPNITARLLTPRLPLSSQVQAPFTVSLALRNDGNAEAELVEATLTSLAVEMAQPIQVVERIPAGGERVVRFESSAIDAAHLAYFMLNLQWRDTLEQMFSSNIELLAEDQRPSSWQSDDVNPFRLGTISNPSRLVGRDEDLDALERILAAGGSVALTGLKRVGKTSLAKVLLARMKAVGWAGDYLPLGQVLSGKPTADELIAALIETIYDAVLELDLNLLIPEPPTKSSTSTYTRTAGRWMRQTAATLGKTETRVLVAFDDFDELPASLYRGEEANALFLFLRSVIDEPWLSMMFVGSEVLPTIMSAQSHKLNQVAPYVVSNFQSAESARALLEGPTRERLDWQDAAFNRSHFLAGGNPYYMTLLGQELWRRMRDLDRTYVTASDVEDAMQQMADTASSTHFVHLWADSTVGLDSDSQHSMLASAILRGVADASGAQFSFVDRSDAVEMASGWLQGASSADLHASVNGLVARGVLVARENSVRLSIPVASRWLASGGGKEVERRLIAEQEQASARSAIPSVELVKLTRDLTFCGESLSEVRLKAWLEQFTDNARVYAFMVARRLLTEGYFSSTRMTQEVIPALKAAVTTSRAWAVRESDAGGYAKNAYVLQHGHAGASSHAIATTLTKLLKIKKANVVDIPGFIGTTKSIASPSILIIADDLAGTGQQLRTELGKTMEAFGDLTGPWRDNLHVLLAAGVSASPLDWQLDDVQGEAVVGVELGRRLRAFDEDAELFESDSERAAAADELDAMGRALAPTSPRGFGDLGLLVATEQNCPNNTLPIFWKRGQVQGADWLPLLERRL